jgi:hypothetical protein
MVNLIIFRNRNFIEDVDKVIMSYEKFGINSQYGSSIKKNIKKIYDTYFFDEKGNTKDVLNFPIKIYNELQKKWNETQENPLIFQEAQIKVLFDLEVDVFPRFVSSEIAEKIMKENPKYLVSVKFSSQLQEVNIKHKFLIE